MTATATPTAAAPTDRSRWLALYVLCAGMLMIVLDATIVNVALPSIQEDLGFSQSNLAWVVNAYLIAFGGLLLLAGRLGDLVGPRRVFLTGLTIFTVASVACALAQNGTMLVGARFIQGVGGALTSAVVLGMIVTMFPDPRDQAKALGVYGFVASAGGSIGLLAGGVLTDAISWHWIFLVNLPIAVLVALGTLRLVEDRAGLGLRAGADVPGAVLLTSGLMLGVYAILQVTEHGWGATRTLVLGAIAIGLLTAFVLRQARIANPLMPLRLFRSRDATGANIIMALVIVGMFGVFFLGALYLQQILGYDALEVGLAFLPSTVVMAGLSLGVAGRLAIRFGPQRLLAPSLLLIAAGLALFARAPVGGSFVEHVLPVTILLGIGTGLSTPAIMMLAMSGATPEDAGIASGLINTTCQVGGAIGLAVLATARGGPQQRPGVGRRVGGVGPERRLPPRLPRGRRTARRRRDRLGDRAAPGARPGRVRGTRARDAQRRLTGTGPCGPRVVRMAPLTVDIWSDVVCGWCYIGKRRLEAALAQFEHRDDVTVLWHSFELDPAAPAVNPQRTAEMLAEKYGTSIEEAESRLVGITETAAAEGLAYNVADARGGNSFDAHRLIHLAAEQGLGEQVHERLFSAQHCEAEATGDRETLERLAVEAGLDPDDVRDVLDGDRYAAAVRADEEAASQIGVRGVPFFVLGRKYGLSGAQPAEVLVQALQQTWDEAQASAAA